MQEADGKMLRKKLLFTLWLCNEDNGGVCSGRAVKLALCGFVYVTLQIIYVNK